MSQILLDSKAFKHNLNLISSTIQKASPNTQIALVLKDNAYGHGLELMANLAKEYGIKSVFVKNYDEAMKIKDLFPLITAMYGLPLGNIPPNVAFSVSSKESIISLPKGTHIELKVNIGMNRNGIDIDDIQEHISLALDRGLHILGVFAHNGYGDDLDKSFEANQARFAYVKDIVRAISNKLGFPMPRFHSLSSSGAVRCALNNTLDDDIVRFGIAAYGYLEVEFPNPISSQLRPVASLWADKIASRSLEKGDRIGYSGITSLSESAIVSTYDIGYGDGFFRVNENTQAYTADGYRILPRSSMDCFSCICDKPRICVFDNATSLARAFDTISYEILTHLSPFIKRSVV